MIIGIGVDVVDLARFERAADRTPKLLDRLFAQSELTGSDGPRPLRSMAARFAAKEAFIKALGGSDGVRWHDVAVVSDGEGNPSIEVYRSLREQLARRGIDTVHLSMSHDAGIAIAYVIAEGSG
ncbi:holo-ACP synthase [soil metagenome]